MSYLDGVHFSTDQISGQEYIPLTYSASDWNGRHTLNTIDETFKTSVNEYKEHPPVTEKPLRKKETLINEPVNWVKLEVSSDTIMLIIIIVFIIIISMQVNIQMKLNKLNLLSMLKHGGGVME